MIPWLFLIFSTIIVKAQENDEYICNACQKIVGEIEAQILTKNVEAVEITSTDGSDEIEEICGVVSDEEFEICKEFITENGEKITALIKRERTKKQICSELDLCVTPNIPWYPTSPSNSESSSSGEENL